VIYALATPADTDQIRSLVKAAKAHIDVALA
jgi:hypothetical protein